jgi:hypothetical protein
LLNQWIRGAVKIEPAQLIPAITHQRTRKVWWHPLQAEVTLCSADKTFL